MVLGSKVKKLEIGDLVSWNSWADTLDTNVFEERNGILMDILTESRIGGEKYMAKILPFGSNLPVIIPLIIVRKSKLKDNYSMTCQVINNSGYRFNLS